MKRLIFFLIPLLLCGCVNAERTEITPSATEIMSEISRLVPLEATREYIPGGPNSEDVLKNYYYVADPSLLSDFCILLPQEMLAAEKALSEIAIFRFENAEQEKTVKKAVNDRYNTLLAYCRAVTPRKLATVKGGLIVYYKNAAVLIITNGNNSLVKEVIESASSLIAS